ncbi:hypothetical protein CLAIMM_14174, partial [Cladophialophora immunda]
IAAVLPEERKEDVDLVTKELSVAPSGSQNRMAFAPPPSADSGNQFDSTIPPSANHDILQTFLGRNRRGALSRLGSDLTTHQGNQSDQPRAPAQLGGNASCAATFLMACSLTASMKGCPRCHLPVNSNRVDE